MGVPRADRKLTSFAVVSYVGHATKDVITTEDKSGTADGTHRRRKDKSARSVAVLFDWLHRTAQGNQFPVIDKNASIAR